MARNVAIDQLRGGLIALVIVGHIVLGSVHDNIIRYAIYAFHMPLFIVLTGYLINTPLLLRQSMSATLSRYWQRVLKPFVVAFIFFTSVLAFHAWQENRLDSGWLVFSFVSPYYHLWFVPTLVIWVVGLAIILKTKMPLWFALFVSVAFSLLWGSVASDELPKLVALLQSKKVVYFFSFFLLGVKLRQLQAEGRLQALGRYMPVLILVCGSTALVYMLGMGAVKTPIKAIAWYALNVSLFLIALNWIYKVGSVSHADVVQKSQPVVSFAQSAAQQFEMMGRLSLPIYLWHVLPLFLLKGFDVHETHTLIYYLTGSVLCIAVVWLVGHFENKWASVDRWVYGVPTITTK